MSFNTWMISLREKRMEKIKKDISAATKKMDEVAEKTEWIIETGYPFCDSSVVKERAAEERARKEAEKAAEKLAKEEEKARKKAEAEAKKAEKKAGAEAKKDGKESAAESGEDVKKAEEQIKTENKPEASSTKEADKPQEKAEEVKTSEASEKSAVVADSTEQPKQEETPVVEEIKPAIEQKVRLDDPVDVNKIFDYWVKGEKLPDAEAVKLQTQDYSVWEAINASNNITPVPTNSAKADSTEQSKKQEETPNVIQLPQQPIAQTQPEQPVVVTPDQHADQVAAINNIFDQFTIQNPQAGDNGRFITGNYNELKMLRGILDDFIIDFPSLDYEIEEFDENDDPSDGRYYNLIFSNKETGARTNYLLDPRYMRGLGCPMVFVPVSNGHTIMYDWIPLGAKFLLSFVVPIPRDPNTTSQVAVPAILAIKATRQFWPDPRLYQVIDMHKFGYIDGRIYQDLGYYLWMITSTIAATKKIKGRYRVDRFVSPTDFTLVSDAKVVSYDPQDENFKPLEIAVDFDGKNITIRSLLDNNMRETFPMIVAPYPPMDITIPPVADEKELVAIKDAVEIPAPRSNYEKELNRVKYQEAFPGTKPEEVEIKQEDFQRQPQANVPVNPVPVMSQINPNKPVDMQAIFNNMTMPNGTMNYGIIM